MIPVDTKKVFRGRPIRAPCMLFLFVLVLAGSVGATPSVLVVYDAESAAHRAILNILRSSSAVNGGHGRRADIRELTVADLTQDILLKTKAGLIITVGAKAAASVDRHPADVSILNVFLPRASYEQIHAEDADTAAAIVLDQPIERQIALGRVLLPLAKRAGIIVGVKTAADIEAIQHTETRFSLDLDVVRMDLEEHPAETIDRLLHSNDMIVATYDREIYSPATAKWLLFLAFQQRRPIVGSSYALLEAGAVGAVFSTPEQVAKHTVELLDGWLDSGRLPAGMVFPRYYHIGLNAPVAEKLGLSPPTKDELQRQVHALLEEAR